MITTYGTRTEEDMSHEDQTGHSVPEPTNGVASGFTSPWLTWTPAPTDTRAALHRALDELLDAHAAERRYVSDSATHLQMVSGEDAVSIFSGIKPFEERLTAAKDAYQVAYEIAVNERAMAGGGA